jgi:hypothetical protein
MENTKKTISICPQGIQRQKASRSRCDKKTHHPLIKTITVRRNQHKKTLPCQAWERLSTAYNEAFFITVSGGRPYHPQVKYLWIESAAARPAPMAKITVAAPVTISPPAQTPFLLVLPVSASV